LSIEPSVIEPPVFEFVFPLPPVPELEFVFWPGRAADMLTHRPQTAKIAIPTAIEILFIIPSPFSLNFP
jgi:hypothetical protein